jgi:hypothetical protein
MKNLSVPWAILIVAGLVAAHLSAVSVTVALGLLLVWALRGPEACIQALTLATLLTYLSPPIVELPPEAGILARALLIVAAIRVLPLLRARDVRLLWPVWLFSLIAALLSTVASSSVPISIMKIVTFAVAVSTVLTAFNALSVQQVSRIQRWFGTIAIVFVGSCLATLGAPRIAFYLNRTGFQGLLNNAQALAVVLSPLAAWQFTGLMFIRDKLRWLGILAAAALYGSLYLSESRTGMSSSLIGVFAAALTWLISAGRSEVLAGKGRVIGVMAVVMLILIGALATGRLQNTVVKFAFKRAESREVSGAFLESRGGGVVSQWQNFVNEPWLGHGFGVYAEGPPSGSVVEAFGIPISAPIEKGFVFTAVLEETGVFGGLAFFTMLFVLGRASWKNQDLRWIALFTSCIAVNVGECILLSPGGIGLFDWLLIGLAISSSRVFQSTGETVPVSTPVVMHFPNLLRY